MAIGISINIGDNYYLLKFNSHWVCGSYYCHTTSIVLSCGLLLRSTFDYMLGCCCGCLFSRNPVINVR